MSIPPYMQDKIKKFYQETNNQEYLAQQNRSGERAQKTPSGKEEDQDVSTRVVKITYEQLTGRKTDS